MDTKGQNINIVLGWENEVSLSTMTEHDVEIRVRNFDLEIIVDLTTVYYHHQKLSDGKDALNLPITTGENTERLLHLFEGEFVVRSSTRVVNQESLVGHVPWSDNDHGVVG